MKQVVSAVWRKVMGNEDEVVSSKESTSIKTGVQLVREHELEKYINKVTYENFDHPDCQYYYAGGFNDDTKPEGLTWVKDCMAIHLNDKRIGFVTWNIRRPSGHVYDVTVFVEPGYCGYGYGAIALVRLIKYLLIDRGFRKVNYSVIEGSPSLSVVRKLGKFGIREVGYYDSHVKIPDNGEYRKMYLFELLRKDAMPCNFQDILAAVGVNDAS